MQTGFLQSVFQNLTQCPLLRRHQQRKFSLTDRPGQPSAYIVTYLSAHCWRPNNKCPITLQLTLRTNASNLLSKVGVSIHAHAGSRVVRCDRLSKKSPPSHIVHPVRVGMAVDVSSCHWSMGLTQKLMQLSYPSVTRWGLRCLHFILIFHIVVGSIWCPANRTGTKAIITNVLWCSPGCIRVMPQDIPISISTCKQKPTWVQSCEVQTQSCVYLYVMGSM
jgi:hypothetical protein